MELQSPSELTTLYETDYYRWLEATVMLLKTKDFQQLDLPHLIEEIEGLAGRERRELKSRLTTLFEHALKRKYVNSPYDYQGWVSTILREQIYLKNILIDSPSLRRYLETIIEDCYADALKIVQKSPDYQQYTFPASCPFPRETERLLDDTFWE